MAKETLWNQADSVNLRARLSKLSADAPRQWGTMNVGQMLRHMDIAYKNAIGEIQVGRHPMSSMVSLKPIKWLVLQVLPFQKNLPTAKEYKATPNIDFGAAYETFLNTFDRITQEAKTLKFVEHPIFGQMTFDEWGILLYKHLDHHLKQFGV